MKTLVIASAIVGVLLLAGILAFTTLTANAQDDASVITGQTTQKTCGCGCDKNPNGVCSCTAEKNCGSSQCHAVNGGTCGCGK